MFKKKKINISNKINMIKGCSAHCLIVFPEHTRHYRVEQQQTNAAEGKSWTSGRESWPLCDGRFRLQVPAHAFPILQTSQWRMKRSRRPKRYQNIYEFSSLQPPLNPPGGCWLGRGTVRICPDRWHPRRGTDLFFMAPESRHPAACYLYK